MQWPRPLEFRSTPFGLFSLKLMFERSKSESLRDVSVTRIGDTLSYGFPHTVVSILNGHASFFCHKSTGLLKFKSVHVTDL